jgi:hypothetical protein
VLDEEPPGVVELLEPLGVVELLEPPVVSLLLVPPVEPAEPVEPVAPPLVPAELPGVAALGDELLAAPGVLPALLLGVAVELAPGLSVLLLVPPAVEPADPVEPVEPAEPAVPLVPPVLPVAPELLLVPALPVSPAVPASFLLHAPSARVATSAASNTEYFISVPLKKI